MTTSSGGRFCPSHKCLYIFLYAFGCGLISVRSLPAQNPGLPRMIGSLTILSNRSGTHADCMYKLQTFGIPADTIPVDETGNFSGENHKHSLENRRAQEREWVKKDASGSEISTFKSAQITAPSSCDVLLGRGSGYFNHVGNVRYRAMVEDLKETYDRSSNEGKQKLTEDVIKTIRDLGGRFLKNDKGVWVQANDKVARQKVGHSFRALRPAAAQKPKASESLDDRSSPTVAMKRVLNSGIVSF
jgi:hypothetical protein